MLCKNCGAPIPDGYTFCPKCGIPITEGSKKSKSGVGIIIGVLGALLVVAIIVIVLFATGVFGSKSDDSNLPANGVNSVSERETTSASESQNDNAGDANNTTASANNNANKPLTMTLYGVDYTFDKTTPLSKLINNGWVLDDEHNDCTLDTMLFKGEDVFLQIVKNGLTLSVTVFAPSNCKVSDCVLVDAYINSTDQPASEFDNISFMGIKFSQCGDYNTVLSALKAQGFDDSAIETDSYGTESYIWLESEAGAVDFEIFGVGDDGYDYGYEIEIKGDYELDLDE